MQLGTKHPTLYDHPLRDNAWLVSGETIAESVDGSGRIVVYILLSYSFPSSLPPQFFTSE